MSTLWKLAGRVYHESIFQGQMTAAGSNVYRLTERMKKDSSYIGKQGRMVQILGSIYLFVVATVSMAAIIELRTGSTGDWNAFVTAASISVQLVIQTGYLMMLTVLTTAEILSPSLYSWLESLPLSRAQVGSLRILSLLREFVAPLAVIFLTLPLVAGIAGTSVAAAAAGVLGGTIHVAFTLGIAVLASWKMRSSLRATSADDKAARRARIITMLAYGVGTLLVVFVMQIAGNVVSRFFNAPGLDPEQLRVATTALALLPLPTAPASLVTMVVASGLGVSFPVPAWMPVVGTALYAALALLMLRRVRTILLLRSETDTTRRPAASATHSTPAAPAAVRQPLTARSTRSAFRHQILQAAGRDTQVLISLLFPLILPLLSVVGPMISGAPGSVGTTMSVIMAAVAGGWMVIHGLTRLQFGSRALEASLPVRERDRVFPRLGIAALLPTLGGIIPTVIFTPPGSSEQISTLVTTLPAAAIVPAALLLKIALFGRTRSGTDGFVLDEVKTTGRFFRWAAVLGVLVAGSAAVVAGHVLLSGPLGTAGANAVIVGATVVTGAGVVVLARRMFR